MGGEGGGPYILRIKRYRVNVRLIGLKGGGGHFERKSLCTERVGGGYPPENRGSLLS